MSEPRMRKTIATGFIWSYLEKLSSQIVSLVVTIILARILCPEEYGIVSIVTIFISICDTLVVGGFSDTLIQKRDADQLDFSTLFWFVLFIGVIAFGIVFATAPLVESFFQTPLVCNTLRIMAIRIPINAINSIQSAYISKKMEYRYFFMATFAGTLISAVVGIVMAMNELGVWALVAQYLTAAVISTIVVGMTCGWHPSFQFSLIRLKTLYASGWKMQCSSLISAIYNEIESLALGKKYSAAQLAFYEKGRQFPRLIMHNVQTSISKVMLPAFAQNNNNAKKMKALAQKSVQVSTYVMTPLLIGMMVCAEEFVMVVLTEKWMPAVPYLMLLSVYYLIEPLMAVNKQIVIASGEFKEYLTMELKKKVIGVFLLSLSLLCFDSPIFVAGAVVLTQIVGLLIQSMPPNRLIGYPLNEQLCDIYPALRNSIIMGIVVVAIKQLPINRLYVLILEVICGACVYIVIGILQKNQVLTYMLNFLKKTANSGR